MEGIDSLSQEPREQQMTERAFDYMTPSSAHPAVSAERLRIEHEIHMMAVHP
jgi:hypothetical protein